MHNRRILILLAVLGTLLGIGLWLKAREEKSLPPEEAAKLLVPADLSLDSLTALELSVGAPQIPQVRIVKDPAKGWRVASAYDLPADLGRLKRFAGALKGLTGEERARGENWFADFGLKDNAVNLTLKQGDKVLSSVSIGRSQKDSVTNFVHLKEGDAIYSVEPNLLAEVGFWGPVSANELSSQSWLDLRLLPVEAAELEGVEIAEWVSRKNKWVVRVERKQPFDQATLDWLSIVKTITAASALDPKEQAPKFQPAWRWVFKKKDGAKVEMEEAAARKEDPTLVVRFLPDGPYFSVTAGTLTQNRQRLLPPPPPPTERARSKESKPKPSLKPFSPRR